MGYADASNSISNMKPEGLPLQPEITHMPDPTVGITFRETMAGGFTLGETDPKLGALKGHAAGNIMAMHATVTIQDLERFLADPATPVSSTGRSTSPRSVKTFPAKTGLFNLFSPTDQPKLELMVYELGFAHGGQDYYLSREKGGAG